MRAAKSRVREGQGEGVVDGDGEMLSIGITKKSASRRATIQLRHVLQSWMVQVLAPEGRDGAGWC